MELLYTAQHWLPISVYSPIIKVCSEVVTGLRHAKRSVPAEIIFKFNEFELVMLILESGE